MTVLYGSILMCCMCERRGRGARRPTGIFVEEDLATAAATSRLAPDDRRKAILAIARDVFLTEGYAAASMSAIASRLGGSKGTLYNYFPSKEALFAEFMRNECEAEALAAHEVADNAPNIEEALRSLGGRM